MSPNDHYTHGYHESVLRSHRSRTAANSAAYLLPQLHGGMSLLDVGCGPGTITEDLAALLDPGQVVGVDREAGVLPTSDRANLRYLAGDCYNLGFPDGSFDVTHAHQLLQHLSDPVAALAEMRRVTVPGGIVAARDSDYAAMTWYPASEAMTEFFTLYRQLARDNDAEPDAGRHLLSWALQAGLQDVRPSASTWCYATEESRSWWGELWAVRASESALAEQALASGRADRADLDRYAAALRQWAQAPDGWFAVLHGEILAIA